ncbi:HpsJ family protein [Spirulina subsalsa]|uniref:HpsJ-like protein, cyanoexosortase A-associated n=1 Tax=Spirulina subsalsa TaxID=54311 RepID=UPI0003737E96|nr:HpsJ family protein [Spirulina subsalsa]
MSQSDLSPSTPPNSDPSSDPPSPKSANLAPPPTAEGWSKAPNKSRRRGIVLSENALYHSLSLLPLVGYALLLFTLVDFVYLVVPPRLTDPIWQFEVMGGLVERIWAPLLGFVCIFYNRQEKLTRWQMRRLRLLSWFALLLGLTYLFLLPLGLGNTWRIHQFNKIQVEDQISREIFQVNQLRNRLQSATTISELNDVAQVVNFTVESPNNLATYRNQIRVKIDEAEQEFMRQVGIQWETQKLTLLKNSVKLNIGTILSGVWLILVWIRTHWARQRY